MFEGSHENPELIWNEKSRIRLNTVVSRLAESHSSHLKVNPEVPWVPLEGDLNALHSYDNSELVISGIYIRLFIANPGWVLRKPREFLTDLLEGVLRLMGQPNPNMEVLETVTTALVKLLEAQPTLSDMVPATGYLSRILTAMNNSDGDVQKPGVLIINELARSTLCVEAAAKCETIGPLKRALKLRSDLIHPTCECFSRLFHGHHDTLVKQALYCNLVQDLLALLESPLRDQVSPSGTKALIVKALKDMQCSLVHGDEVNNLLRSSPIWSQYESQKHDLFLPDYQNAGYLTSNPGVAGYLTTTRKAPTMNVPPPMDDSSSSLDNSNPLL